MNEIVTEIGIVFALILLNAFFSGAEMAFISLRKTRVKQLAREGNKTARLAEKMLQNPEAFLATIQVGITLMSTIASAFAGAKIADAIAPFVRSGALPLISENADFISFAIVVITITYFSIVVGELIPKSLGIKFSERFTLAVARPLHLLSQVAYPITALLTASSNIVLKLFGDRTSFSEANLTEEELRTILYESHKAGTIKKYEHELLDNIFDFGDIAVAQVMTPRPRIFAVDVDDPFEMNVKKIIDSGYTRIPVFRGNIGNIIGIFNSKSLLAILQSGKTAVSIEDFLQKPYFVPNTSHSGDLLKKMQKEKIHIAIVTDEHGDVDGIVTIEDILEEIVGDINDEDDEEKPLITRQGDGRYDVDGSMSIVDFNKYFKAHLPKDEPYTTISGLLLNAFEQIAEVGTKIIIDAIEFTVKEKTGRVITSVQVRFLSKS
ncbi:HlyC/CorC family transporter [Candidatus Uhrbacteria bacterium]|nr:HlyC/CorC family transporter [Candidatus Uhrbacteria bacterium]